MARYLNSSNSRSTSMPQVVEVPGLTSQAEAEQRAEDFRIDGIPVEIVRQPNGTFTVRATYPDDVHLPGAIFSDSSTAPAGPRVRPPAPAAGTKGSKTLGPKGEALIKSFESCQRVVTGGFQAYRDPVGVLTIGWGHTRDNGRQFTSSDIWTQADCDTEFRNDMEIFVKAVKDAVKAPINQDQFDAVVSFAFNVGAGNLRSSTLLQKLNASDFSGAAQQFQRWNKAAGKVLPGLTRRRACESLLFQSIPDTNFDGVPD
jgi:lysozyme